MKRIKLGQGKQMRDNDPRLHAFIRGLLEQGIVLEWTGFGWNALFECRWVPVEDLMSRHWIEKLRPGSMVKTMP
jgi:hypothetical protein